MVIALAAACIAPIAAAEAQSVVSQTRLARDTMERAAAGYDRDGLLDAVDGFERALAQNRSYTPAWVGLVRTQVLLEDFARAEEALQAAVELRHDPVELDLLRAQLATLAGDLATASERYAAVLQRQPYNEEARVAEAVLLLGNGTTATALRRLRGLTRSYPANRQLLTAIAVTASPGMPNTMAGIQDDDRAALLVAPASTRPSGCPVPNFSGVFEVRLALE